MNFEILSTWKSINLSTKTKKYAFLAVISGLLVSAADIFLASTLSSRLISDDYIFPLLILIARSVLSLLCNFLILKFTLSSEIDLKVKSFEMPGVIRDNFFKLISFNTAHMALTSCLRMFIEIILIILLVAYIYIIDSRIILASLVFGVMFAVVFYGLIKYSAGIRSKAAAEQSIFLSKATSLVALSDRAEQLGATNFFRDKLRLYSKAYSSQSVKSLFIAQSFKPILEPMIFIVGFYLNSQYSVSSGLLYLLYRVANGAVVLINGVPTMDHYLKQYKNAIEGRH